MKFEEKYPDAVVGVELEPNIIKVEGKRLCFWCGRLTAFAEINYEGRICSDECLIAVDKDYNRALTESNRRWKMPMPDKLLSVFPEPNVICQSEYTAIYDCIVCGLEEEEPEHYATKAYAMLREFQEWAESLMSSARMFRVLAEETDAEVQS